MRLPPARAWRGTPPSRSSTLTEKGRGVNGITSSWRTITSHQDKRAQLRAGVVGIGKQALEDHIPGLLASDGAKLVAICDENPEVEIGRASCWERV